MRKPGKVYLHNPNLAAALLSQAELHAVVGPVRETFFYNQVGLNHDICLDSHVDFSIPDGPRFDVGGRSKSRPRAADEHIWLALDDVEVGSARRIPLWLFGFLY